MPWKSMNFFSLAPSMGRLSRTALQAVTSPNLVGEMWGDSLRPRRKRSSKTCHYGRSCSLHLGGDAIAWVARSSSDGFYRRSASPPGCLCATYYLVRILLILFIFILVLVLLTVVVAVLLAVVVAIVRRRNLLDALPAHQGHLPRDCVLFRVRDVILFV